MSEVEKFEQFIKDELEHYAPKVSPHIWDNIVAERERRKPKGWWFSLPVTGKFILLAGILATGTIAYHSFFSVKENVAVNLTTESKTLSKAEKNSL